MVLWVVLWDLTHWKSRKVRSHLYSAIKTSVAAGAGVNARPPSCGFACQNRASPETGWESIEPCVSAHEK